MVVTPLYLEAIDETVVSGTPIRFNPSLSVISHIAADVAIIFVLLGTEVSCSLGIEL